jgi:hypothetical protein
MPPSGQYSALAIYSVSKWIQVCDHRKCRGKVGQWKSAPERKKIGIKRKFMIS